jgi:hypothetical protein
MNSPQLRLVSFTSTTKFAQKICDSSPSCEIWPSHGRDKTMFWVLPPCGLVRRHRTFWINILSPSSAFQDSYMSTYMFTRCQNAAKSKPPSIQFIILSVRPFT